MRSWILLLLSLLLLLPAAARAGDGRGTMRIERQAPDGQALAGGATATAAQRRGPDLTISSVSVPSTITAGEVVNVRDATRNGGQGRAKRTRTRFVLSADARRDAKDAVLAARTVKTLTAGKVSRGTARGRVPASAKPGKAFVIACADGGAAVKERSERNNCKAVPVAVRVKRKRAARRRAAGRRAPRRRAADLRRPAAGRQPAGRSPGWRRSGPGYAAAAARRARQGPGRDRPAAQQHDEYDDGRRHEVPLHRRRPDPEGASSRARSRPSASRSSAAR